nr:putative ribonuclease H-like domain-containing protein [Tanacetum cinerariifolium]
MSVEEIERVVAQRVANAIEAIAIYETKTNLAHKSMSQTERQEEEVVENASNKRRWESNHNGSLSQQNKGHKCKLHHSRPCTEKYGNCKKVGHIIQNFETPATAKNRRTRTCCECGSLGHYKSFVVVLTVLITRASQSRQHVSFFSAALFSSSIQQHQLIPGSTNIFTGSNSDYGGATQDRKSTTRGCQFLGRRLISWQCNKKTIMATSTTEAEYLAAASGCGQVLWIQNQMLDYREVLVLSCEYWNA